MRKICTYLTSDILQKSTLFFVIDMIQAIQQFQNVTGHVFAKLSLAPTKLSWAELALL